MIKPQTVAALYTLVMGVAIFAMWAVFLAAGQTPELATTPVRFTFHLVAEGLTAVACIGAGVGLISGRPWGRSLYLIAAGLLLYAVAQAAGYFLAGGNRPFAALFVSFAVVTLGILWRWMQPHGPQWSLVFLGMVLYATVQTTGYFAQQGEVVATTMFVVLAVFTLVSAFVLVKAAMTTIPMSLSK
jgi:hypothetical protein